jgi:hypothetical protein
LKEKTQKSSEHLLIEATMKYQFIKQYKQEFPVVAGLRSLGLGKRVLRLAHAFRKSAPARRCSSSHSPLPNSTKRFKSLLKPLETTEKNAAKKGERDQSIPQILLKKEPHLFPKCTLLHDAERAGIANEGVIITTEE